MGKTPEISDLLEVSRLAGSDILLVQGAGGNTSVKSADGTRMWIKASGFRLSEVKEGHGYVEIDLRALSAMLRDRRLSALSRADAQEESTRRTQAATCHAGPQRPSLETGFHGLLARVVVHTHPVYVNAFTCMQSGEEALADAIGEPLVWVRYEPPGYALAVEVDVACATFRQVNGRLPAQTLLCNHGLIATAASGAGAMAATLSLVDAGKSYFGRLPSEALALGRPPGPLATWAEGLERAIRKRSPGRVIVARTTTRAALLNAASEPDEWLMGGPLIPDDVVYGTHEVWRAEVSHSPQTWLDSEIEALPERMVVAVPGLGVILVAPHRRTLDIMEEYLLARVLTLRLMARRGHASVLPQSEVRYLEGMESEHYRQRVAAPSVPDAN